MTWLLGILGLGLLVFITIGLFFLGKAMEGY